MLSRMEICNQTAQRLRGAANTLPQTRALIGMDGFVDFIIDVVDQREDCQNYSRIATIESLGQRITAAAGKSANYELVVRQCKLGGNGPIMANALAIAGIDIDYIGSLGSPDVHPVFTDFAKRARLYSIGEPGYTDALEFADGKLMLGKITQLADVNWSNILRHIGIETLTTLCERADLIALNNWTMLPNLGEIWQHLIGDVLPRLSPRTRRVYVDLADPQKRPAQDIHQALQTLSAMQEHAQVCLGLNLNESAQIARVLGLTPAADQPDAIRRLAAEIRAAMGFSAVVIHPRGGAAGADAASTAWFQGPYVRQPRLSTGAGDNFNAGFCLGQLVGCNLEQSLACGCATSGYYVRNAASPSALDLAEFLDSLPAPE